MILKLKILESYKTIFRQYTENLETVSEDKQNC